MLSLQFRSLYRWLYKHTNTTYIMCCAAANLYIFYVLRDIQGCALGGQVAKYPRIYLWRLKQCCDLCLPIIINMTIERISAFNVIRF